MAGPRTLKVLHGSASRTLLPGCPWWSPGEVLAYPKAPPVSAAEKMTQRSQHMQLEAEPGQTPSDAPPVPPQISSRQCGVFRGSACRRPLPWEAREAWSSANPSEVGSHIWVTAACLSSAHTHRRAGGGTTGRHLASSPLGLEPLLLRQLPLLLALLRQPLGLGRLPQPLLLLLLLLLQQLLVPPLLLVL